MLFLKSAKQNTAKLCNPLSVVCFLAAFKKVFTMCAAQICTTVNLFTSFRWSWKWQILCALSKNVSTFSLLNDTRTQCPTKIYLNAMYSDRGQFADTVHKFQQPAWNIWHIVFICQHLCYWKRRFAWTISGENKSMIQHFLSLIWYFAHYSSGRIQIEGCVVVVLQVWQKDLHSLFCVHLHRKRINL